MQCKLSGTDLGLFDLPPSPNESAYKVCGLQNNPAVCVLMSEEKPL